MKDFKAPISRLSGASFSLLNTDMFEKLNLRGEQTRQQRKERARQMAHAVKTRGRPVFERFGIRQVYLFGSVSREVCHDRSDIDLWVSPLKPAVFWQCKHELEEQVGFPIGLYTADDVVNNPNFVYKIIERGILIYETST